MGECLYPTFQEIQDVTLHNSWVIPLLTSYIYYLRQCILGLYLILSKKYFKLFQ